MSAVIFDIDGTLADATHRLHYIVAPYIDQFDDFKKKWPEFLDAAKDDTPKYNIIHILKMYFENNFKVILCTGRREDNRGDTVNWLAQHNIPHHHLFMRSTNDRRPDYEVKAELYEKHIVTAFPHIIAVYEDRDRVVEMWRDKGLTCLQVQKGDY